VNAPADPPGTTQARDTLPTTEGPETTQDTAHRDEGHQGRGPSWPSPSAGSLNRSREESQRHPPHLATTTSNKPQRACSPSSPARAQTTQNKHAGALTEALHGDAYHPESLRGWQVVTEDQHGTTRIKQSQYLVRLPNTIEAWALGLQEGGPSYRKGGTLLNATPPLMRSARAICWRAASKHTTDDTPRQCATDATRRTHVLHQTLHTLPRPLKMKQNSGDARLAATPTTQPPPRLLWCAPLTPGRRKKTSPWTPVWQQQSRSGTRSTKTRCTPECRRTRQGPHQQ
jgi:hypothetical protein